MGRIRSIKPELLRARELAEVPPATRWTLAGLLTLVDDFGYGADDARTIKADIYALDDVTTATVEGDLAALAKAGVICRYAAPDGTPLLHVLRFRDQDSGGRPSAPWGQKPQRPQPYSRFPACEKDHDDAQGALFGSWNGHPSPGAVHGMDGQASGAFRESLPPRDQGPGTRDHRPKTSSPAVALRAPTGALLEQEFAAFWAAYPRRTGKRNAVAAYVKARTRATPAVIVAGAQRYHDDPNRVDQYTKHPTTWLNGDCWGDAPLPRRGGRATQQETMQRGVAEVAAELAARRGAHGG